MHETNHESPGWSFKVTRQNERGGIFKGSWGCRPPKSTIGYLYKSSTLQKHMCQTSESVFGFHVRFLRGYYDLEL